MDKVISTIEQNEQANPDFYRDPDAPRWQYPDLTAGFWFTPESAEVIVNKALLIHSNTRVTRRYIHSNFG